MTDKFLLTVNNLSKSFLQPNGMKLNILDNLNLNVSEGTVIAITGVSGSGKSTLLHLIGGLDTPDLGTVNYKDKVVSLLKTDTMARYRNEEIGFLYQFHYLLPELSVIENVAFPFLMNKFDKELAYKRAKTLLGLVGIEDKENNMPSQLSGGERQRVAIARSLVNKPNLLLADEPTGNLDFKTGEKIFLMFRDLIKNENLTAIIVTHNENLANLSDYKYKLKNGKLIRE